MKQNIRDSVQDKVLRPQGIGEALEERLKMCMNCRENVLYAGSRKPTAGLGLASEQDNA